jgi:uncharacterized membrane protein
MLTVAVCPGPEKMPVAIFERKSGADTIKSYTFGGTFRKKKPYGTLNERPVVVLIVAVRMGKPVAAL